MGCHFRQKRADVHRSDTSIAIASDGLYHFQVPQFRKPSTYTIILTHMQSLSSVLCVWCCGSSAGAACVLGSAVSVGLPFQRRRKLRSPPSASTQVEVSPDEAGPMPKKKEVDSDAGLRIELLPCVVWGPWPPRWCCR